MNAMHCLELSAELNPSFRPFLDAVRNSTVDAVCNLMEDKVEGVSFFSKTGQVLPV